MLRRTRTARYQCLALLLAVLALAGCGTTLKPPSTPGAPAPVPAKSAVPASKETRSAQVLPPAGSGRGGYYQDDGPGELTPEGLQSVPDAEPKVEPYSTKGNRPYVVFGKSYTPMVNNQPFKQRGRGSWYGKKFHGQKTSSGELYDMYKMTAAHPTLPIPSYARVTNIASGAQVIVRVNDRGPFHSSRVIDLSYTAALKLGYIGQGSAELEVERLLPDDIQRMSSNRGAAPQPAVAAVAASVAAPAAQTMTIENLLLAELMPPTLRPAAPLQEGMPPGPRATAATGTTSAVHGGVYLQLGSFNQSDNANAARMRLLQNWVATLPTIEIAQSGSLFRLYCGPFATRTDAAEAALQIQDAGIGIPRPFIVQR